MQETPVEATLTDPVSCQSVPQEEMDGAQIPAREAPPWAGSSDPLARRRYLHELSEKIAEMTAHIDSATGRLLKAIAEYDRYEGWASEFPSCAHWLAYRCQLNMRTARERVRVARALERLPRIAEALNHGKLSYAKVRAMARISKPENESEMLYLGLNSTAEHMERIVQGYRRATQGESLEEVASRQEARYLEIYHDGDGMVVIRARLTPEVGAVVKKALEGALQMVRAEKRKADAAPEGVPGAAGDGSAEPCSAQPPPVLSSIETENTGVVPARGGSAEPLDLHALRAGPGPRDPVPRIDIGGVKGLPAWGVIDDKGVEEWVLLQTPGADDDRDGWYPPSKRIPPEGFEGECATDTDETGQDPAQDGSAEPPMHQGGAAGPGVEASGAEGRIQDDSPPPAAAAPVMADPPRSYSLSPEAIAENRNLSQDHRRDTLGQLRADALGLLAEAALGKGMGCRERGEPYQVVLHVDAGLLAGTADEGRCELEGGPGVSLETCRRIACDAPVREVSHGKDGDVVDVGRRSRKIPVTLWRVLQARDEYCRFPGCYHTGRLQGHHIVHWAQGGETSRSNVISLCKSHHWKVHEGGYRVEGDASGQVVFRRPDGSVMPWIPSSPQVPADPMGTLVERNRVCGIEITPETNHVGWGGEPLDLVWIVEGILQEEAACKRAQVG